MNILLTVGTLDALHGSVMHVLELANYLTNNHSVTILTSYLSAKIKCHIDSRVQIYTLEELPENLHYDLIWSYHFPILGYALKHRTTSTKLIAGSLSSVEPLESFPVFWPLCSKLQCISPYAAECHSKRYSIPLSRISILENIVPLSYLSSFTNVRCRASRNSAYPSHIAVVSNHPPKELKGLANVLKGKCKVSYYGGRRSVFITPQLLSKHDVIVSIGKTIQYALVAGIPAFNYDHFGGDGYITLENLNFERFYHFTGKPNFRKLTAYEIATEIFEGYRQITPNQLEKLQAIAKDSFLISRQVDKFLLDLQDTPDFAFKQLNEYRLYLDQCELHAKLMSSFHKLRTKKKMLGSIKHLILKIKAKTNFT